MKWGWVLTDRAFYVFYICGLLEKYVFINIHV